MQKQDIIKIVGGLAGGLLVGFGTGYFVARKQVEAAYREEAEKIVSELREHYITKAAEKEYLDEFDAPDQQWDIPESSEPEEFDREAADRYIQIITDAGWQGDPGDLLKMFQQGVLSQDIIDGFIKEAADVAEADIPNDREPEVVTNLFEAVAEAKKNPGSWMLDPEYQEYVRNREDSDRPYVISISEYMSSTEPESFEKITLRYFEGDDTLVDDRNEMIPDTIRAVGEDALTMFGKFSNDENVVYVRKETDRIDIEIVRDSRSYTSEVLGMDDTPSPTFTKEDLG